MLRPSRCTLSGRLAAAAVLTGVSLIAGVSLPHAAPLDAEACARLKEDHGKLVESGAKANMERGPEWAKANLPMARLEEIQRLIGLEEQLAFRCPQPKAAAAEDDDDDDGNAAAKAKPKPKSRPKPAAAEATTGAAEKVPAVADSKPKPKAKPKPKPNDAYVPPPKQNAPDPAPPTIAPKQ